VPIPVVPLLAVVPIVVGAFVLRAHPRHPVGWLLVAHGLFVALTFAAGSQNDVVDQLSAGAWVFLFLGPVLITYLLPDGHAASPFWRRWVKGGFVGVVAFVVGAAGDRSGFRESHGGAEPPLAWLPEPLSDALGAVGLLLVTLLIFGSVFAVRARLRRASGDERLQLLWLVWGALTVPIALLTGWVSHFLLDDQAVGAFNVTLGLAAVALPMTIGIAILRYRLFDIQVVLSRSLTYLLLVIAVVGVYALLLLATDRFFGSSTAGGLLAVGVVAVAIHPAYAWVRVRIERWVYGYRSAPHEALRLLADRAEAADPERLIASITETVAEALRVDRVWVSTEDSPSSPPVRVPLVHRGERVGDLAVAVPNGRQLSSADIALLRDLARYVAVLVRSEQQAAELRASRSRIVGGREEERKRLRRDLHDGVGPSLAAIVLKLNAAESRRDELERNELLAEIRDEVRAAIGEVRRLVDDLRPPAIDEVGLLAAIRQRAAALTGDVIFEVAGPDDLPPLPAAVEVAAYRIASEAMTNVARHAEASRARVAVSVDGAFELTVTDNGRGTDRSTHRGVGWTSMRERAAELGGSCTITSRAEGGLVVRAVLPLREVSDVEMAT
jgi:two-component system, NarL family, sensor kinase